MRPFLPVLVLTGLLGPVCAASAAQDASPTTEIIPLPMDRHAGRWRYSRVWDDNVPAARQAADHVSSDSSSTVLNPRADLDFNGSRGRFSAAYDGAFELYRQFNSLNNYGQQGSLNGSLRVSPHTTLFTQQTISFDSNHGRAGARRRAVWSASERGLRISGQASITRSPSGPRSQARMQFQWIAFNKDPILGGVLIGGHGQGGNATLRHQVSARTSAHHGDSRRAARDDRRRQHLQRAERLAQAQSTASRRGSPYPARSAWRGSARANSGRRTRLRHGA